MSTSFTKHYTSTTYPAPCSSHYTLQCAQPTHSPDAHSYSHFTSSSTCSLRHILGFEFAKRTQKPQQACGVNTAKQESQKVSQAAEQARTVLGAHGTRQMKPYRAFSGV